MAKRYVDANILDDLANNISSSRGDLQEVLSMSGWRVNEAPGRGWDHGAWADVRSTISTELRLLDNDTRSLRDRARRTRTAAAERALWEWVQDSMIKTALRYAVPVFATLELRWVSHLGKLNVAGPHLWRILSGIGDAKRLKYVTAMRRIQNMAAKWGDALVVVSYAIDNWTRYGRQSIGKVITATAIDSALYFGLAAVVTGVGVAVIGATTAPVWLTVLAGVGAALAVNWVRTTGPYKAFVNASGKMLDDAGKAAIDVGRQAVVYTAKTVDSAAQAIGDAGKRIDAALTQSISAVTKPFDAVGSWFAPQKTAQAGVA